MGKVIDLMEALDKKATELRAQIEEQRRTARAEIAQLRAECRAIDPVQRCEVCERVLTESEQHECNGCFKVVGRCCLPTDAPHCTRCDELPES